MITYPTLDISSMHGLIDDDKPADNALKICSNYSNKYICESDLHEFFQTDNTEAIKLLHINCRSINKNFTQIKNLLSSCHPITALAVSETWLSTATQDIHQIPGYTFISSPRVIKTHGGVGIYVNELLHCFKRTDISIMTSYLECLFIEIPQSNRRSLLIGCIYKAPNADNALFNMHMLEIIIVIQSGSAKLTFLLGDYNLDLLKYQSNGAIADFLNNMISHSFFPTIRNPTRITDTSASLLDNIFTNCIRNSFSAAIICSDISDHFPVAVRINLSIVKNKLLNISASRSFNSAAVFNFNQGLMSYTWADISQYITNCSDPSEAFLSFFNVYKHLFDKCFPLVTRHHSYRMTPRNEWMTKSLIKSCNKKSRLYKKYRLHPTVANKDRYVAYRNKLKTVLKKAERSFFAEKFNSYTGDMRRTWNLIGLSLNRTKFKAINSSFIVDGIVIDDGKTVADKFNEFFVNIGISLSKSISESPNHFSAYLKSPISDSMSLFMTDASEIIDIVMKLPNKNGVGTDDIPIHILKSSIAHVAEILSTIINCSFQSGIFPDGLKIAKVIPVFKDGENNLLTNYRPISVLSCFSKIFEKALYNRLLSFLERKNVIVNEQYGFRENHSTYMAVMKMYEGISSAVDNKDFAVGIFVDLAKAFDSLNHEILLGKLAHYGIRGIVLDLFRSYLQNRYQYVSYNGSTSTQKKIVCGVPQGSILGPILFLIYINDIVNCSDILKFILFADDTNLYHSDSNFSRLISTLNFELHKLSDWLQCNKLSLNVKKCHYILFGHKKIPLRDCRLLVVIDGHVLEKVERTKFLGIIIDAKLTWSDHVNYISLKILKGIGIMCKLRSILPSSVLLTLYYTLIYPYLTYCIVIWGCANMSTLHKLVILQKRAIRIVTCSSYLAASNPLFVRLRLLKLSDIYRLQLAVFMFKYLNFLVPLSCRVYFKLNNAPVHHTRVSHCFFVPSFRTIIREHCITVSGPRLWNGLPLSIRSCNSFTKLKQQITNHFMSMYI